MKSVLLDSAAFPSPLSADERSVLVRMVHRYYAAVWTPRWSYTRARVGLSLPPAVLLPDGGRRVSPRSPGFSCMRFLGVAVGSSDHAGLNKDSRLAPLVHVAFPRIFYRVGVRVVCFSQAQLPTPAYAPVYASLASLTVAAQDSGPSGSLILSRKNFCILSFMPVYPRRTKNHHLRLTTPAGSLVCGESKPPMYGGARSGFGIVSGLAPPVGSIAFPSAQNTAKIQQQFAAGNACSSRRRRC